MKKLNYLDFEVAFEKSLEIVTPKITTENMLRLKEITLRIGSKCSIMWSP